MTSTTSTKKKRSRRNICLFGTSANPPTGQQGHVGIVRALAGLRKPQNDDKHNGMNPFNQNGDYTTANKEESLLFDEIRVVPVYSHPFSSKRKQLAPFEHRLRMCEIAFEGIPNVTISKAEAHIHQQKLEASMEKNNASSENNNKNGKTTTSISVGTADLLEYYLGRSATEETKKEQDEEEECQFSLCLGADTFLDLTRGKWRRTQDILDLIQGRFVVLFREDNSSSHMEIENQEAQLKDAILLLEEIYGHDSIHLLHVPTLGAVSSTLVRSLSSELSLKSMGGSSTISSSMHNGNGSRNGTGSEDNGINDKDYDASDAEEQEKPYENNSNIETVEENEVLEMEERMKQMVDPKVYEYMRDNRLYGFGEQPSPPPVEVG